VGSDGRSSPQRVAAVIGGLGASIVALQEVESVLAGDPGLHQLNVLADATGMQAVAGPTVLRADSHYGNALLTSAPVRTVRRHDLSVPGREPRGALDVELDIAGRRVRVVVTHLGLRSSERRNQGQRLLALLRRNDTSAPTLLLGDFNEWRPWAAVRRLMRRRFGRTLAPATYPARRPLLALDRMWAVPSGSLVSMRTCRSALCRTASDHLPLVGEILVRCAEGGDEANQGRGPGPRTED
jgi:endonuclease/exonuclease/phosphatase family metal-dependent hydrolase